MKKILPLLLITMAICTNCINNSRIISHKEILAKVDQMDSLVTKNNIPALQYCYKYYNANGSGKFRSDSLSDLPYTLSDKSIFQAASLSKPVFAYIVMRMVDNGEIDLDTPICEYTDIDRFTDKESARKLTPRIVLSHRTGLPNWATGPSSDEWPVSPINFKYPVDSCFAYSGEGYAFLQRAVEAIRHSTLDEIARKEVFEPLNMPTTSYKWLPEYDTLAIPGFNRAGENRGTGRHPRESSAYTLRTNATEYARFVDALMTGTGLSQKSHKEILTIQTHATRYADEHRDCDSSICWCLGVGAVTESATAKTPKYYWHWGDNGNFKALFVFDPAKKNYIVYFTNSAKGHDIADEVIKLFFNENLPVGDWINL
ncbi:MAG: serine hydrolase [Bacteroidales bacterium]|nr:serine hydrolase [Bacteroidales bacterium]